MAGEKEYYCTTCNAEMDGCVVCENCGEKTHAMSPSAVERFLAEIAHYEAIHGPKSWNRDIAASCSGLTSDSRANALK